MSARDSEIVSCVCKYSTLCGMTRQSRHKAIIGWAAVKLRDHCVLRLPEMTEIFFAEHNAELLQFDFIFGE